MNDEPTIEEQEHIEADIFSYMTEKSADMVEFIKSKYGSERFTKHCIIKFFASAFSIYLNSLCRKEYRMKLAELIFAEIEERIKEDIENK
jgi:hypothetical protein